MTTMTVEPQTELGEKTLEDAELLDALEKRREAKEKAATAAQTAKLLDERAKMLLEKYELADGEVARIGDFRIEKRAIAARHVEFDTDPSSRLTIKLAI